MYYIYIHYIYIYIIYIHYIYIYIIYIYIIHIYIYIYLHGPFLEHKTMDALRQLETVANLRRF